MNGPFAEMLRYNRWANALLFEFCSELTDAQLAARSAGASGDVRELLTHIAGAQQTFVLRTKGRQHEGELTRGSAWPGFDRLVEIVATTSDELVSTALSLEVDANVDLAFLGKAYRYPKSFFLVHAAAHGVEHRTEIALTLGALGIATPDLDGWAYAAAAGFGADVTQDAP